jgi:hypothetical protein
MLGGDWFRVAILDFDFGKYNLIDSLVGFDKGFFSAVQEKCCVLYRN